MSNIIEITLAPSQAHNQDIIRQTALQKAGFPLDDESVTVVIRRRSVDARSRTPHFVLGVEIFPYSPVQPAPLLDSYKGVHSFSKSVVIVGAGPAGYFAALEFLRIGIKPIIVDRGKDVRARRRDLRAIQQFGVVNPHSNYCFGEGGAGTYSDGKLYTRSSKRGNIRIPLQLFVEHGAKPDILYDTHPHIGSNKLPGVVSAMRETILRLGGEVHFDSHVTDFIIVDEKNSVRRMVGVVVNDATEYRSDAVVLATGHSARDIFYLCQKRGIDIQEKPFALGVRIEHQQQIIDKAQYGQLPREKDLPAASYRLAATIENRGVYSFCMCPGGLIVPAATAPGELVVNGMSMSRRDSPYANSGLVVEITRADLQEFESHGVFAALAYQATVERTMFEATADGSQKAPAQRVEDFVHGRVSQSLPTTSYIPGIVSRPLHELLPSPIATRLRRSIKEFGKRMKGYYSNDAVVVGVESRTSSPITIPRDSESLEHTTMRGLFPCGEGAGYAGGIISAAIDGQRVATAVAQCLSVN